MRAPQWLRRMFGADVAAPRRQPGPVETEREQRVQAVISKADRALAHRARIDAEVDRVERYLRGVQ